MTADTIRLPNAAPTTVMQPSFKKQLKLRKGVPDLTALRRERLAASRQSYTQAISAQQMLIRALFEDQDWPTRERMIASVKQHSETDPDETLKALNYLCLLDCRPAAKPKKR